MAEHDPPAAGDAQAGAAAPAPRGNGPTVNRRRSSRISWVWVVPLVAALVGLSMVVRTWLQTGPEITISFQTAEGLEIGKTQVRYKDVVIGTVSNIQLSEDRSKVLVRAQLTRDAASLAREGTRFWVVRPRLGVSGVSGLGTLLSGAYIGMDVSTPEEGAETVTEFVGLETPPEVTSDRPGTRYTLQADNLGSLDIGSPVYYRQIQVGRVIGYQLDESGRAVNLQVFVDAPNDAFVTEGTRFWNASGIDLSLNAAGLSLRTQSLISLAAGGVAFETITPSRQGRAAPNSKFKLYEDESSARAEPDGAPLRVRMRFDQSVRGLAPEAPVDFRGIDIGHVTAVRLGFDAQAKRFYAQVDADLYPQRLGPVYEEMRQRDPGRSPGQVLAPMVRNGLRAQLRTGNLLTGQLYVALDFFPRAAPHEDFDPTTEPLALPTMRGNFDQLQQQLSNIVEKIEQVPFDKIGQDLRATLQNTNRLLARLDKELAPEMKATLRQARESLAEVDNLLSADSSMPVNLDRALQELTRAARSLRILSDSLQANPEMLIRGRAFDNLPGGGP
ncbi:MlaD family protein [Orrella sp. JC864]|uniref:PqiB family protein n=1 Tax=Orrella sp. JC864 TaxID=3120298 RepID=UPI00300AEC51